MREEGISYSQNVKPDNNLQNFSLNLTAETSTEENIIELL